MQPASPEIRGLWLSEIYALPASSTMIEIQAAFGAIPTAHKTMATLLLIIDGSSDEHAVRRTSINHTIIETLVKNLFPDLIPAITRHPTAARGAFKTRIANNATKAQAFFEALEAWTPEQTATNAANETPPQTETGGRLRRWLGGLWPGGKN